jgi:hypothetical protein
MKFAIIALIVAYVNTLYETDECKTIKILCKSGQYTYTKALHAERCIKSGKSNCPAPKKIEVEKACLEQIKDKDECVDECEHYYVPTHIALHNGRTAYNGERERKIPAHKCKKGAVDRERNINISCALDENKANYICSWSSYAPCMDGADVDSSNDKKRRFR